MNIIKEILNKEAYCNHRLIGQNLKDKFSVEFYALWRMMEDWFVFPTYERVDNG